MAAVAAKRSFYKIKAPCGDSFCRWRYALRVKGGGARRDRTADLLHAMQALSQLSYGPDSDDGQQTTDDRSYASSDRQTVFLLNPSSVVRRQSSALSFLLVLDVAADDVGDIGVLFFLLLDERGIVEGLVHLDFFLGFRAIGRLLRAGSLGVGLFERDELGILRFRHRHFLGHGRGSSCGRRGGCCRCR